MNTINLNTNDEIFFALTNDGHCETSFRAKFEPNLNLRPLLATSEALGSLHEVVYLALATFPVWLVILSRACKMKILSFDKFVTFESGGSSGRSH